MDGNQFKMFLEHQTNIFSQLMNTVSAAARQSAMQATAQPQASSSGVPVPQPSPLALEGDMSENFDFFERNWENYSKAIGMDKWPVTENERKVSFLLTVIGEPARKKFFNFELTAQQLADPEAALAAIKDKVIPKRNVIIDRLDFFSAGQSASESIDDFCARLRVLAKVAKLGVLEKELLAYKVVTANKWPQLRTKMLTITDITLEKAVDLCRAEEIAAKRSHELGICTEVNKVVKTKGSKQKSLRCKFCGDMHEFAKGVCPALGKRCHKCKGKNHFEKVCKSGGKLKSRKQRRVKEVKEDNSGSESESDTESELSQEESSEEYEIGKIYDNSNSGGSVMAELNLKFNEAWENILCELDTGANTSLIGYATLAKLSGVREPTLLPSKLRLQSFGGSPINVLGQVKIPCRRLGKKFLLVLQVVDVDHRPLLSARASKELGLVKFCNTVTFINQDPTKQVAESDRLFNIYRVEALKIIERHEELFTGYGKLPGTVKLELDHDVKPSIQPPRRVPIAMRGKLKQELESLEKDGIITKETSHTDWVSNIVVVQRGGKDSAVRICLDPIHLNKALRRPNLQFVTLDEILPELGKAKVFSTMDARKGFWHIELDEQSSKLTTFWTPFGRYRWTRLPFGIAPAPEIFQIKLQEVIEGLDGVECIADDLLVYGVGETIEEALANHNRCLEKLLCRLQCHNVKLNRSKLKLCERSVKFYGHLLTDEGLKPDDSKIEAIREYPRPSNRKEVHRFIGMVTYLGRFIRNLSANLTNLRKLIPETQPWKWTSVEENEFNQVKALVSDIGTLRYYDVNQPITIECDASCIGLGVAVFQQESVIGYASRTLTSTEKNYAQIEKELLAIVFACVRFDQLIVGNPKATVKTDHKPLLAIFKKPLLSAPRRLQHMLLNLQRYNLSVEFVTGKNNVVADALSRAPSLNFEPRDAYRKENIFKIFEAVEDLKLSNYLCVTSSKLDEIMHETKVDPTMQLLIQYVRHGWPDSADGVPDSVKVYYGHRDEISTQDGLIFCNDRILIPHMLRKKLVESCHASHNGVEATLKLARANLFWPGMSVQIKDAVKNCSVCAKFSSSQPNPPMRSHEIPVHPFQLVSMDVFFAQLNGVKGKFLVTVDHFSDFFEVNRLNDLSPESVVAACKQNFCRYGIPQRVVTDNGTNFTSQKMVKFAADWDFELVSSAPHHQQANGKAEAAVKIAKHLMKKADESGSDFWYALLHWRNIPNKIGSSPVARLFSRSTRCGVPTSINNLLPKLVEDVPAKIEENRRRSKLYYDRKTKNLPKLSVGSPVYVQVHPESSKQWSSGAVSHRYNDRSYSVNVDGTNYRRSLVHLKPRKDPDTPLSRAMPSARDVPSEHNTLSQAESFAECSPPTQPVQETPTMPTMPTAFPASSSLSPSEPTATMTTSESTATMSTSSAKSKRVPPVIPTKLDRPRRNIRVPEKLKDFRLEF